MVGAADSEQVAHVDALGEPLDLLAPLGRTVVVANPLAAKDQVAAAPSDRDRGLNLAANCRGRRLVEEMHSLLDFTVADERQALYGDPNQFQIGVADRAPKLGRLPAYFASGCPVAFELDRDRCLVQRQPA